MNILVLSWRDPKHPMSGGAEQVMHEHMKGWINAGHSVTLFSSMYVDNHGNSSKKEEILDGVRIIRRGRQILDVQIRAFIWYLFFNYKEFDLIVDQFHGIPFFTPLYMRPKKLAVVQEVAREVWLKNHLPKPFNLIIGIIGYIFEPIVYCFYKKVPFITGSESAKKDLISVGIPSKNITIIHHGVKLILPKKVIQKEKKKTVIFLGAVAKDKGIEDAIRTFAILKSKFPNEYNFWVVGKVGELYKKELEVLLAALNISKEIHFYGFVDDRKKFELLARAHVLINPSVREGWGLVNIEANSTGTPIVAYNSQGLVDSVKNEETGIICSENTPNELAKQVHRILSNKLLYKKLQKGSIQWSRKFLWSKSREASLRLIQEI